MRSNLLLRCSFALMVGAVLPVTGCKREADHDHDHSHNADHHEATEKGGHGHGEESPSGASFKAGKGVMLTTETREIIGLKTAELEEQKLPRTIRFNMQMLQEPKAAKGDSHGRLPCTGHGSGLLTEEQALFVRSGQMVKIHAETNRTISGTVLRVKSSSALGEPEVIVCTTEPATAGHDGKFLPGEIMVQREESVPVIPEAALLRTAEGSFVYAVNGEAYIRTPVKTGARADGKLEIVDGLLAGDAVVTHPVETLWLIELRATKGGGHSH